VSPPSRIDPEDLSLDRRLDRVCGPFEAACKAALAGGPWPRIEDFLSTPAGPGGEALVRELILLEVHYRRRAGEHPAPEGYRARFPGLDPAWLAAAVAHPGAPALPSPRPGEDLLRRPEACPPGGEGPAPLAPAGAAPTVPPTAADSALVPAQRPGPMPGAPDAPGGSRYELLGEIGRGGMGAVLKGRDPDLGRDVAVKVLLETHRGQAELVQRFVEEAQIAGQLQHPGIAPVYELGRFADQRPYFAMKLVKGQTLAALLAARTEVAEDRPRFVGIFEQVCQTVAYAHSQGVLHRDLKPSNIMVGAFGEVQVMDWGLAKVLGGRPAAAPAADTSAIATVRTQTPGQSSQAGAVMGTPAYMAPEQARGEVERLDERCDVFGLGAILCVILTGQPPYRGGALEVRRRAAEGDLADACARLDGSGADAELVHLAKACLDPDSGARPRDAGAVARAVAAYQAGVQERLRRAELERAAAEAGAAQARAKAAAERRARRFQAGLAAAVLGLAAGGAAAGLWYQNDRARRANEEALRRSQWEGRADAAAAWAAAARERALDRADRPAQWQGELAAALEAIRQAEALLAQAGGSADPDLQGRVRELTDALAADERDRALVAHVDHIRLEQSYPDAVSHRLKRWQSFPELRGALEAYGLRVGDAERAVGLVGRRPGPVREKVVGALDFCLANAAQEGAGVREWLLAVLAGVDGDPWRTRVRQAFAGRDGRALARLVREAEVGRQPPGFLALLAVDFGPPAGADRVSLLRRAQRRYPGDFWVNLSLAYDLHQHVNRGHRGRVGRPGAAKELPLMEEALGFYRAALALRPDNGVVYLNLGSALQDKGDLEGAVAAYRRALDLDPKYAWAHIGLGAALYHMGDLEGAVAAFRRALALDPEDAMAHTNLGNALRRKGDLGGALAAYRRAMALDPKYAPAHYGLGNALYTKGDLAGAGAAYRKAITLDPRDAQAHSNFGLALYHMGDLAGAVAAHRRAIALDPKLAAAHNNLGLALKSQGDLAGAVAAYRRAITLDPQYATAHYSLGLALAAQGDLAGAVAAHRRAIALDPKDAKAHYGLGFALRRQGDLEGAIAAYRQVIALDPKDTNAHNNLGNALRAQGDLGGAVAAFRRALALDPKDTNAHYNLGLALDAQGDLGGAVAAFRRALALDPKDAEAHNSLGFALRRQGDLEGAVAAFRRALDLDPTFAPAHCNLGHALHDQGHFRAALQALQRGHELGAKDPRWRHPSADWVRQCQRLVDLDARLPAILQGDDRPKDAQERLALADLCQRHKRRYAAAARFYAAAFAEQPKLVDDPGRGFRYNAACAAALAAAGQGQDADRLSDEERTRLRRQALDWLRADLAAWTRVMEKTPPQARPAVQRELQHWQKDPDLAGLRDKDALAKLPAAEGEVCRKLWADVDGLLSRARD
jgi:tetratricopeptide (TPR) repeat protein